MAIIRLKTLSGLVLFFLVLVWAVIACAAAAQVSTPSWFEHIDLMQAIIVGLSAIVAWFLIRTLRAMEANQKALYEKYNNHEHRLSTLEGAHSARTNMKLSCSVEE